MIRRLWFLLCGPVVFLAVLFSSASGAQAAPGQLTALSATHIPSTQFFGVAGQRDGGLVATGEAGSGASARMLVARFAANGALDTSFGSGGIALGPLMSTGTIGEAIAVNSAGQILVAGQETNGFAQTGMLLERFTSAGRLDSGFGSGGVAVALGSQCGAAFAIALQNDGKAVLGGTGCPTSTETVAALARFNSNGSLDTSFGGGGAVLQNLGPFSVVDGLAVDGAGKIVIAGSARPGLQVSNGLAARFNANGSLDGSFGSGGAFVQDPAPGSGSVEFRAVSLQGSNIVLAGDTPNMAASHAIVVRLSSGGHPDASFNGGHPVYLTATSPALTQPPPAPYPGAYSVGISGSDIIVGGFSTNDLSLNDLTLWSLGSSGSLDGSFGHGGITVTPVAPESGVINALAISPSDGSILVAGAESVGTKPSAVAARYTGFAAPPPPPPPGPAAPAISIKRRYSLSAVERSGLAVKITCHAACSIKGQLVISNKLARHLRLISRRSHRRTSLTIAQARLTLHRAGSVTIRLRLTRGARRALAHHHNVHAIVVIAVQTGTRKTNKRQAVLLK